MPEPSEIDLIQDKIYDPKTVLDEYCDKYGLNSQANINARRNDADVISSIFKHCDSVFNNKSMSGNSEIEKAMSDVLNFNNKNKKFN